MPCFVLDKVRRIGCVMALLMAAHGACAIQPVVSQFDMEDYDTASSSQTWAQPPGNHHHLYLDVFNKTDFFDTETGGTGGFADHTQLADTIRPTATILWDERFRIQIGLIAEKAYGSQPELETVDPWLQLLWKPTQELNVVFGDLNIPHYYLPALFYPSNYFEQNLSTLLPPIPQVKTIPNDYFTQSPTETGAQLILKKPFLYDDLFFNYEEQNVGLNNEKFVLGFVHRNNWKWLYFNYQAHWLHYGGENDSTEIETRNDVAQAAGLDAEYHPFDISSVIIGGGYTYLRSHLRQDSSNPAYLIPSINGHGNLWQVWARYGRVKLIFGDWRGHDYYHQDGDPMFTLPNVDLATIRWDIILARDFNLYLENTEYFIGNNDMGYNHVMKTALLIQGSWQFSIPIMEWSSPAASPEGQSIPARWDYGI
jgi:hypothetical protein